MVQTHLSSCLLNLICHMIFQSLHAPTVTEHTCHSPDHSDQAVTSFSIFPWSCHYWTHSSQSGQLKLLCHMIFQFSMAQPLLNTLVTVPTTQITLSHNFWICPWSDHCWTQFSVSCLLNSLCQLRVESVHGPTAAEHNFWLLKSPRHMISESVHGPTTAEHTSHCPDHSRNSVTWSLNLPTV